jgi:NAD(P)-dependent dehydrogenase (short-subunit alcohol dehydrogenase family)
VQSIPAHILLIDLQFWRLVLVFGAPHQLDHDGSVRWRGLIRLRRGLRKLLGLFDTAEQKLGPIRGLVNNAGVTAGLTRVQRLKSSIPMQRAGGVEEVAEGVLWLLSPAASYTTGAILAISGGRG